jgi:hypothetical protein
MDYLKQYKKDFWDNFIKIHEYYSSPQQTPETDQLESFDVVTDLMNLKLPVSATCLPIAKQIAISEQQITVKIPRIGDLLIGIMNHSTINKVNFIIYNHSEKMVIEGTLKQLDDQKSIWIFTELPIPLICLDDYNSIYLEAEIHLNDTYNLQKSNQDVFRAFYGYFNTSIQYHSVHQIVYEIPMCNQKSQLLIVCGLWTIVDLDTSKK